MNHKPNFTDLATRGGHTGRNDCQWGWYDYVRERFKGMSVLDVGTGLSKIKERWPECQITTHEASEQCPADIHGDLAAVSTGSFHAVTCFDVIEHVVEYGELARNLSRIARRYVFVTTPGAEVTHNYSEFHFHEFEPWEILQLMQASGLKFVTSWAFRWAEPIVYPTNTLAPLTGVIEFSKPELLSNSLLHPIALLMEH